ncbi:MAG: threonine ammonia-lyase [Actinomycetia bacterium]|jgi:threonine dehydratase|nr:threonine ammonia-lyase [Actinomycetes bacterium]MDQ1646050.1 threonine dehydratase [Cryptosporangiaceae bacterium]MDQ1653453.1 threonine dehydratase [Cryptosporangiaceae bacterium]MDQ1658989.1 threonine dehydratase [Cryptosporangiaceae bacterium]
MAENPTLVRLDDVLAARELLANVVRRTPLEECAPLAVKAGGPAWLKCENLQLAGSFKIRGAYVRIARLSDAERARGVVAASAGNHAQGVALAAGLLGTSATVFMPTGAPLPKLAATKAYGADVRLEGDRVDDSLVAAKRYAEQTGAIFIHPFDHFDIVAGQGTVGLEILEQCPDVRTILVGVGGGGLLAGICAVVSELKPEVRVVGAQAAGAAAFPGSIAARWPVPLTSVATIADGIAVGMPGELTLAHVLEHRTEITTVTEEDISEALLFCLERAKLVVEPAGGVGVAALLADPRRYEPPVVAVLSGGNIDPLLLHRVIEHGLAAAGRYLHFHVRFADRPGTLSALTGLLAEQGVNVLDVEHRRHDARLHLGEVEVSLSVETKGNEHSQRLLTALRKAGYEVSFG